MKYFQGQNNNGKLRPGNNCLDLFPSLKLKTAKPSEQFLSDADTATMTMSSYDVCLPSDVTHGGDNLPNLPKIIREVSLC